MSVSAISYHLKRILILLLLLPVITLAKPPDIDSINRMAVDEWSNGNYQKALDHITKAYEFAKAKNDRKQLALVLNTLGLAYWRLGNNADAMQSYLQSAEMAEKLGMQRLLGLTHTNMGLILKEQGEFEEAFKHNNLAINIFRKTKYHRDLGIAYNNQGQIWKNMGRIDSARVYYNYALTCYKLIDYKDGVAATYYNLADICLKSGLRKEALEAAYHSLDLSRIAESKIRMSEAYEKLSQIYEHFGDSDSALKYFKKFNELNKTNMILNQSNRLAELQAEMGAEVKNLQIQNLQNEKKLAANRIWLFGITVLIIILTSAFFVYRYVMKISFKKENLERELKNSAKIIEVKEQELKAFIIDLTRKNSIIAKMQEELTRTSMQPVFQVDGKISDGSQVEQLLEQKILTDDDWSTFKAKFKSIYPGFFTRIKQFSTGLTEAEERLLVLIYLDLSGREMANTLGISPQSVRVCKMRMKKKLQDKGFDTVEDFLMILTR